MSIIQTLNTTYLSWFVNLPHVLSILIVSLIITLITTLVYKFATDQKRLKELKIEMKGLQEEAKKQRANPKKSMEIQKKMMGLSGEQMRHSFSSMIYTFLPVILIFAWMNASLAYEPLTPNQPFNITIFAENVNLNTNPELNILNNQTIISGKNIFTIYTLSGKKGTYTVFLEKASEQKSFDILITDEKRYLGPNFRFKNSVLNRAIVSNEKVKPLGNISLLGWRPGWLGLYIIFSLLLNTIIRKLLDVA